MQTLDMVRALCSERTIKNLIVALMVGGVVSSLSSTRSAFLGSDCFHAVSIDGKLVYLLFFHLLFLRLPRPDRYRYFLLGFDSCSSLGSILMYVRALRSIEVDSFCARRTSLSSSRFSFVQFPCVALCESIF